MKFTINTKVFQSMIAKSATVASGKTTIAYWNMVTLKAENGKLYMYSMMSGNALKLFEDANVAENGKIVVDIADLKMFSAIKGKNVSIETDGTVFKISDGKKKISVNGYTHFDHESDFEKDDRKNTKTIVSLSENFLIDTLSKLDCFRSDNENKPVHTGFVYSFKDNFIGAVDGYKCARRYMPNKSDKDNRVLSVSGNSFKILQKLYDKKSNFSVRISTNSNKEMIFSGENYVLVSNIFDDEPLDINKAFSTVDDFTMNVNSNDVVSATKEYVKNVGGKQKLKCPMMFMSINNKVFTGFYCPRFSTVDMLDGNVDGIETESGEEFIHMFNPKYIMDAMKVFDGDVKIRGNRSSMKPFVITDKDIETLVLPIAPKDDTKSRFYSLLDECRTLI